MHDPYVDPATGCLRNRLGIDDPVELQNAERSASLLREQSIRMHGLPGAYDLAHLQAFHCAIFQDVYPWAGEIRTCELARTHPFCRPEFIEEQANQQSSPRNPGVSIVRGRNPIGQSRYNHRPLTRDSIWPAAAQSLISIEPAHIPPMSEKVSQDLLAAGATHC